MMNDILENLMIDRIARNFHRAPHKINNIHEADAELIDLGKGNENYLAITTDALVEEVASGLYSDPHLIGWMLAMANLSDLAAVGADPLGLLVSMSYPSSQDEEFIAGLTEGVSNACQRLHTFVLGGDTNQGKELFLSGCAVGLVPKEKAMTRMGATPEDKIYLSGPAGLGSIFAFLQLSREDFRPPDLFYQPVARIDEGKIARRFATSCMDTSDGVIHTVDTLMRLNRCQIILYDEWDKIIHPIALQVCKAKSLPPWLTLASVHGEFELCFTIKPQDEETFLNEAAGIGWFPILIGEVGNREGVSIKTPERLIPVNTALIRNIAETAGSDPQSYINKLLDIARHVGI